MGGLIGPREYITRICMEINEHNHTYRHIDGRKIWVSTLNRGNYFSQKIAQNIIYKPKHSDRKRLHEMYLEEILETKI